MSVQTKPASETLAEIENAIGETQAKLVSLSRDLDAARTEAVASGQVGAGATSRVKQLSRKLQEAEARLAELQEQQVIASVLVEKEQARAREVRQEQIRVEAAKQRARESGAWEEVGEAFSAFLATVSQYQSLVGRGLETRAELRREFASDQDTLAALLRVVSPAVVPTPADLQQVVEVLTAETDARGTSVALDRDLQPARRSPEPPFSAILKESEAPPWGFVRSG